MSPSASQTERTIDAVRLALTQREPGKAAALSAFFSASAPLLRRVTETVTLFLRSMPASAPDEAAARALEGVVKALERAQPAAGSWLRANGGLLQLVARVVARQSPPAALAPAPGPGTVLEFPRVAPPADLWTEAQRRDANLAAIALVERGGDLTADERRRVLSYSGWGGLSIQKVVDRIPDAWRPDSKGLLNEYYTPWSILLAAAAGLRGLVGQLGEPGQPIRALEPAAGVGRALEAFSGPGYERLRWTACEISSASARMVSALFPSATVHQGSFEAWVKENPAARFELVVTNPPYGQRGAEALVDPDKDYREDNAFAYFLRRSLDFLEPEGLGVFVVPNSFISGAGAGAVRLRKAVFQRHHLVCAFRLPSEDDSGKPTFPGVNLVTDLVIFRARGGELAAPAAEDESVLAGRYFAENPTHVLGREERSDSGSRIRYAVVGKFAGLPPILERPRCAACELRPLPARPQEAAPPPSDLPLFVEEAASLGRRTSQYLTLVSRGTPEALQNASRLHAELRDALVAWFAQKPADRAEVVAWRHRQKDIAALLSAWDKGALLPALDEPPKVVAAYTGSAQDIPRLAAFLYGARRKLVLRDLLEEHQRLGGHQSAERIADALLEAGWAADGSIRLEGSANLACALVPEHDYYSGWLWPKYDRVKLLAGRGDAQAEKQAKRLLAAIAPRAWSEIRVEPRYGWVPLRVLEEWLKTFPRVPQDLKLERNGSLLSRRGYSYAELDSATPLGQLLGYLNTDLGLFKPRIKTSEGEQLDEKRVELAQGYAQNFADWIDGQPESRAAVVEAHNRLFAGWVEPAYSADPLPIARWNPDAPLYGYQRSGVRRLVNNHGGGLFYDVGLGKTRTLLATLALAREQGWARRPVIVVPNSIIWKWKKEIARVLPDFRVVVIGSVLKVATRGKKKGKQISETDTPAERGTKWQRFKAGLYDVALLTYSSLERSKLDPEQVERVIAKTPAMLRQLSFSARSSAEKLKAILAKQDAIKKLTTREENFLERLRDLESIGRLPGSERQEALMQQEIELAAADLCDPGDREPDTGVSWHELGIDFLAFDESHVGKNLWTISDREGGRPAFLSSPESPSRIAEQMFFRAAIVRERTGGSGIILLDATPAKNSPLEFASVYSILDTNFWSALGISDIEQFFTQFLRIEKRVVTMADLRVARVPVVAGFQNLQQLRPVIFRFGEYQTARKVGLKLPEVKSETRKVPMGEYQEFKYRQYLKMVADKLLSKDDPGAINAALGLMARMSLVAMHGDLDGYDFFLEGKEVPRQGTNDWIGAVFAAHEKAFPDPLKRPPLSWSLERREWTYQNAQENPNFSSAKFEDIADQVLTQKGCGHLIFCESVVAHIWLREVLVRRGIPRERIALLNAIAAPDPLLRQQIAEGFTDEPRLYDVVIANVVAYEGIDLQKATCQIIHADLPWEPATLQQRNGRAQRQGNVNTVLRIVYVLSDRSTDMRRFALIQGKRGWMVDLLEGADNEINNPGAQMDLSPEEWLTYLSRDESLTQQVLASKKGDYEQQQREETIRGAWIKVRTIASRRRDIPLADPAAAARLEADIASVLAELRGVSSEVWPWYALAEAAAKRPALALAPRRIGAMVEGAIVRPEGKYKSAYEIGRMRLQPQGVYVREFGQLYTYDIDPKTAADRFSETVPSGWDFSGTHDYESERLDLRELVTTVRTRLDGLVSFRIQHSAPGFRAWLWSRVGLELVEALIARNLTKLRLPFVSAGRLAFWSQNATRPPGQVIPWTDAGWEQFRGLVPGLSLGMLRDAQLCAEDWFGSPLPISSGSRGIVARSGDADSE